MFLKLEIEGITYLAVNIYVSFLSISEAKCLVASL